MILTIVPQKKLRIQVCWGLSLPNLDGNEKTPLFPDTAFFMARRERGRRYISASLISRARKKAAQCSSSCQICMV